MKIDLLELMTKQLKNIGVQTVLLRPPYENISDIDCRFQQKFFQSCNYQTAIDQMGLIKPGIIMNVLTRYRLCYTFFAFPDFLKKEYDYDYCCIGPFLFGEPTNALFRDLVDRFQFSPDQYREVQEYYNSIPVLPSSNFYYGIMDPLLTELLGGNPDFHFVNLQEDPGAVKIEQANHQINPPTQYTYAILEKRYDCENALIEQVSLGNTQESLRLLNQFVRYRMVPDSGDEQRDLKNTLHVLNTLLRKAAQTGMVHPFHIDHLASQFALQIESSSGAAQLSVMPHNLVRKYCMLVNNYSRKSNSPVVQHCLDYVDSHYREDLSLDSLSKICSVSGAYLSSAFKKETGRTVTDYIHATRIRQSLILLNTTTLSVQEISEKCGYPDANYYARIFKKYQRLSPKEYRKMVTV